MQGRADEERLKSNRRDFVSALLLAACAIGLFAGIAADVVTGGSQDGADAIVAAWFHSQVTPALTLGMLIFTQLHGTLGISAFALLFAWYLWRKRERYWLLSLCVVLPPGMLINVFLKHVFARARPEVGESLLTLATYSFPSGHVAGATLFYGVLAVFLCSRLRAWHWRAAILLAACMLVVLVAVTRLYLGVHYFTDLVAAAAWATAWVAVCLVGIDALRRRRSVSPA